MADTACPISAGTWPAALASAHVAVAAAREVLAGAPAAYALCRPPGHHAFADMAGGFCYVNNTSVAAQELRAHHARIAILDVDLHHGNGTQGIFYGRDDVLTVSLHADPVRFYPFFWGHADERGEGPGLGYNLNLPLARGTGDDEYILALERALHRIRAFAPGALVVALGLDAHKDDPLAGLALTTDGFAHIGAAVAGLGLASVLVQEGGYLTAALGTNLQAFLRGFEAHRRI
jgi:acetoin utilization deacetylase AcuC-like enzyme